MVQVAILVLLNLKPEIHFTCIQYFTFLDFLKYLQILEQHIVTTLTELSGMNTTDEVVQVAADIVAFETRLSKVQFTYVYTHFQICSNILQIWDDYNYERKNFTVAELSQLWPDVSYRFYVTSLAYFSYLL